MEGLWAGLGGLASAVLVALITLRGTKKTTDAASADKFRADLMERIEQQDRQLEHCEEGHRETRREFDELRREHVKALEHIDMQAGSIRRLEEQVAQLQRQAGQ